MGERLTGDYRRDLDKPYLGHWDIPGEQDLVLTIDHMEKQEIKSQRGTEKKTVIIFKDHPKPLILNVTNRKSIAKALESPNYEDWEGRRIALYEGKEPKADDGLAIRIREYAPKVEVAFCEDCGEEIRPHGSYTVNKIVTMTKAKYGEVLCWDCAKKRKEAADEQTA